MNIKFYLSLLVRRLPVMLIFLIVCSVAGIMTAFSLPPTYATTARLLVEDAQIETSRAVQNDEGAEQLQVIEQRLLTRANMIEIANKHNVFENMREMTPDEIVAEMMSQTRIFRSAGRNQATLMTVAFSARSGIIARDVLNEYITIILEDARSQRETQTTQTLSFFEREVERLERELDEQSVKIVQFKNVNANALPEDAQNLRSRQAVLLDRIDRLSFDILALKEQREELVTGFETTGRISASAQVQLTPEEQQLTALRLELERLRSIYSDTYPGVVSLRGQIERLEAVVLAQPVSPGLEAADVDPQTVLLNAALGEVDDRIELLEIERTDSEEELNQVGISLAAVAGNAIALDALEREHENIQTRYNAALNSLDRVRMEFRVLSSNQSQRITVIEGASLPQEPTGPDRPKIAAMGVGAGLGLAGAYFALLEFLNRNIRRPAELQSRFNIVPIASIPYIESRRDRMKRRSLLLLAVFCVLIGVPAMLWAIDTYYQPLEVLVSKVLNRIGL